MFIIYTITAVIISILIESVRINLSFGKVKNINKVITYIIGVTLFGICLVLIYDNYYDTPGILEVGLYSLFYMSIRGILYDPLLNLWTNKELDYISTKTNSIIDLIERIGLKWDFWTERFFYFIISLICGIIYNNFFLFS